MTDNTKQDVPTYLQCQPRTYIVERNHWHDHTFDLKFTVVIKCTDEILHEINNFWSGEKYRLIGSDNDIEKTILKMIGTNVFWYCYRENTNSLHPKWGVNSIFANEGWYADCFEITKLDFENFIRDEDFDIQYCPE